MEGLTNRQQAVLTWIETYIADHEFPPTIREISIGFDCNHNGIVKHLEALERKGFLRRTPGVARGLRLL